MDNVRSLIESLGGVPFVARELGLHRSTVSGWIYRHRVPPENWDAIIDMAQAHHVVGVDEALLYRLLRSRGA